MTRCRWILLAALCALCAVLAGCGSSHAAVPTSASQLNDNDGSGPYEGFGLVPPQPRPSFTLTDTHGQSFSFAKVTAGHPTLLYFGYTMCPDECPTTMADVRLALGSVPASVAAATYVVFVSTDVEHDTAAAITAWLSHFDTGTTAKFVGLHGTQAQIDAAQAAAHVNLATDGGQTHATNLLLYGADNYARVQYLLSTNESDQLAHDLPLVATT